jgi:hypothetical protein
MKITLLATALLAAATLCAPAQADDKIFILGALHGLHESEDSFSYTDLEAIIKRIAPDVMVLEVRPDELMERKDTPGRPEYPAVIWPMLDTSGIAMVAMEPGGEDFARMTGKASAAFEALGKENPEGAAFLRKYRQSLEAALVTYWQSPAMSQDTVTATLAAGYARVQLSYLGADYETVQQDWDGHMADVALETAKANPDKRILVLASFRNRQVLTDTISAALPGRVSDMAEWLRQDEGR